MLYTQVSCIACKIFGDPNVCQMNLNKRDQTANVTTSVFTVNVRDAQR